MTTRLKSDNEELQDGKIIPDGGVVRVRMTLMDGIQQREIIANIQGSAPSLPVRTVLITDAERLQRLNAQDERDRRLSNAWKNPPPVIAAAPAKPSGSGSLADIYAARDARLENAWRGA